MKITIFQQTLHDAQCAIYRKASPCKIADPFPMANVVFPSGEKFCLEVDDDTETMSYDCYIGKWSTGEVARFLDNPRIDYIVH